MSTRPEVLFPLFSALETLPGIGAKTAALLTQSGIERPRDLALTLPHAVVDRRPVGSLAQVVFPAIVTVPVTIDGHVPARRKGGPAKVLTTDDDGATLELTFFHARGDYLEKSLPVGSRRLISGKAELFDGVAQMVHPDYMLDVDQAATLPQFEPIYPLTQGVSQKVMARAAQGVLDRLPKLGEWIDSGQKQREDWPDWAAALHQAHNPQSAADTAPTSPARMRLAYDEFFAHQMTLALARRNGRRLKGRVTRGTGALQRRVLAALPYDLTGAQTRAVGEITADMASDGRMNRLLQGDVGAGKTLVALMSMLAAVEAGGQAVMMAPTEILARQHLESLLPLVTHCGARLELLTGRDKGASRVQKLADLADGKIDILVGTHAVFQKDVFFHDLRMVVIDEQHRFGVAQRMELGQKGQAVDVLVMTATPIPRSLALSQYGDMDLSVLDEKPPGRSLVRTALMPTTRMAEVIDHLKRAIAEGRQAYWVCPLVEESEKVDLASAEERFASLRATLGEGVAGLVHGQMPPAEKDAAMADFVAGRTRILVATTVIEVGVNVPNASIMVIERAEIFGLAQLHQLRGRVGRGSAQSTCLMLYQAPLSQSGERRLAILRETEDGFRIAEEDLAIRGAGDMIGTAQSGLPRFRIANLEAQAGLMAIAQSDARTLLTIDPTLETERGRAARHLLWLMGQDRAIRLMDVG